MSRAVPWYISAVLYVAIPLAVVAALYLSIPGEMALARTAGWTERYAPAMPVCLSVYALAAGAISWYRRQMHLPGERTALIGGAFALVLAMSAQSISHLIEQDYMGTSAKLVVAVSCVPPLVIAHLVHMAESPSQGKSVSDELEESRGFADYLTTALVASEAGNLLSHSTRVAVELSRLTDGAAAAASDAERAVTELERDLNAAEKAEEGAPRRKALTANRRMIEKAREDLSRTRERVTVSMICESLGISSATYYRHVGAA
ncbi:hypothetical protein ACFYW9_25290 [Streptomyces sp. NPDC002698]|uniref:hypothetical protein n=1 Tax=Streptomyces sp. NPDC002698 TaxID=3364660 RepID=UPI0036CF2D32